jgi:hypothetical protein
MPAQSDILTSDALGLAGVPADVAVRCLALPWQIAQSRTSGRNRSIGVRTASRCKARVRLRGRCREGITLKEEPDTLHWVYSPGRFHY